MKKIFQDIFFFLFQNYDFAIFFLKKIRRTRKSLSSSCEQIKEFNDFQFKYFPLKSEKRDFISF